VARCTCALAAGIVVGVGRVLLGVACGPTACSATVAPTAQAPIVTPATSLSILLIATPL
jgi:hypothetical protein